MYPAVFLDRDGVINFDYGYISKVDDFEIIPGTIEALKKLQKLGFKLVIFTNQSGIGRGIISLEKYNQINKHMESIFTKNGIEILEVFHCPHVPEDKCHCRKPQPGMINKAVKKFNLDKKNSIVVGDKETDISAGISAGIQQNYLIDNSSINKDKDNNLYVYNSLYQLVCKSNVIKL